MIVTNILPTNASRQSDNGRTVFENNMGAVIFEYAYPDSPHTAAQIAAGVPGYSAALVYNAAGPIPVEVQVPVNDARTAQAKTDYEYLLAWIISQDEGLMPVTPLPATLDRAGFLAALPAGYYFRGHEALFENDPYVKPVASFAAPDWMITIEAGLYQGAGSIALVNGDFIHVEIPSIGVSVDLIVGGDPNNPGTGFVNDAGGNWAALIEPYLNAGNMSASNLLSGSYTLDFDKEAYVIGGNPIEDLVWKFTAEDVSAAATSPYVNSVTLYRVGLFGADNSTMNLSGGFSAPTDPSAPSGHLSPTLWPGTGGIEWIHPSIVANSTVCSVNNDGLFYGGAANPQTWQLTERKQFGYPSETGLAIPQGGTLDTVVRFKDRLKNDWMTFVDWDNGNNPPGALVNCTDFAEGIVWNKDALPIIDAPQYIIIESTSNPGNFAKIFFKEIPGNSY